MSPPLVVAFALAGRVDIDLSREPLGKGQERQRTSYLKDIWPSLREVRDAMQSALKPEVFRKLYTGFRLAKSEVERNPVQHRQRLCSGTPSRTYIQEPPFFADFSMQARATSPKSRARARLASSATA